MTSHFMSPPRRRGSRRGCTFPGFPSTRERHSLSCHPHDGGVQPWSRPPWISVYAGMTSSFMSPPQEWESRPGRVLPASHSCGMPYTLVSPPRKRGSSPVVGRRLDSRLRGNDSLFHVTPQEWESRPSRVLPASHSCGMPYTLVSPPRKRGSSPVVGRRLDSRLRGNDSLFHVTPQEWESRPSRVLPASHSCGMPYTLVSPPRKRGSSPVVGRRLDSRLRGNDILFHVTPTRVGVKAWSCPPCIPLVRDAVHSCVTPAEAGVQAWARLPWIPTSAGCHTLLCHPRGSGGPVLSWDVVWIPAFAGMTASFMSHPRKRG